MVGYLLEPFHPKPRREYGDSRQPVAVWVEYGFKYPGVYHLPAGTMLKTILAQAHLWPEITESGLPERYCYLQVTQILNGRQVIFKSSGLPTQKELDMVLSDRAVVTVLNRVKWTL